MSYESFVLSLDPASHVPMDNIDVDNRVEDIVLFIFSNPTEAELVERGVVEGNDFAIDVSGGNQVDFS